MLSIDADVLRALYDYSRESGERLDDIYDQALRDYLKKKGQPVGLKQASQQSARQAPANDRAPAKKRAAGKTRRGSYPNRLGAWAVARPS
jgi:hypothetical protein